MAKVADYSATLTYLTLTYITMEKDRELFFKTSFDERTDGLTCRVACTRLEGKLRTDGPTKCLVALRVRE